MPLLDHFRPPLSDSRHWESFQARWAGTLADRLDQDWLPSGYFAEVQVHVGGRIEVDVAAFGTGPAGASGPDPDTSTSTATATAPPETWSPPEPDLILPATLPDVVEILIFHAEGGPTQVAAVELVSPGDKDRPESRRAFAAKSASYLQAGVGLAVVDIVTSRKANLHDELVGLLDLPGSSRMLGSPPLYAAAYRPGRRPGGDEVAAWLRPLAVGQPLPTVPLALRGGPCLPLDLEATYADLCRRVRLAGTLTPGSASP